VQNQTTKRQACPRCAKQYGALETICPADGTQLVPSAESSLFEDLASRYEIVAQIGSGGWSTVYKARHNALNQLVAIKVLHQHLSFDSRMLQRFEQEAQTASTLSHPSIVGIIDYGSSPQPYIVMEFLEGRSLAEEIETQKRLSAQESISIALEISAALTCAHRQGIVHRDIKPSNIILTKSLGTNQAVKVVDFGLSKLLESDAEGASGITRTGEAMGSPPYMSPEQWAGKGVDARTDIYALGCLLYEAVTGKQAFPGSSAVECMNLHLTHWPEAVVALRPNLPEADLLDRIIFKALQKESDRRYQTTEELSDDLTQVKTGGKLRYAERKQRSLVEWLKWRRALLLRVLIALVSLAVLIVVVVFLNRETILSSIWSFNYKAGEQALAAHDSRTAQAKLTTALTALELSGGKDERLFKTLKKLAPLLKEQLNYTDLTDVNRKLSELTMGSQRYQDLYRAAYSQYGSGHYAASLRLCDQVIAEARRTSKKNLQVAWGLYVQGKDLANLSRFQESETVLNEALQLFQDWLGNDDPTVIACQRDLARTYAGLGRLAEARKTYENVLAIQERIAGSDSLAAAITLSNLGGTCYDCQDLASAERYLRRSILVLEKTFGTDQALAGTLSNLGQTYLAEKRYAEAEPTIRRAINLSEKFYGQEHPETAKMLENMSILLQASHRYSDALPFQKRALKIREARLGADNPVTVQTRASYERLLQMSHEAEAKAKKSG
jgi:serine/threonine protein kinase